MKLLILAIFSFLAVSAYSQDSLCYQECLNQDPPPPEEECRRLCTVTPGQGNPLQLFSYELTGSAPVIDGSLMSRDGDPGTEDALDEWKAAASRTLILDDGGVAQLFLVNTADTLYVGMTYEHGNNGDGSGVVLHFDEGQLSPPGAVDSSSDLILTATGGRRNENAVSILRSGGGVTLADRSWTGSAWADDGDGATDFRGARHFYSSNLKVHHHEFAIPLNNAKTDDSANSDLDLSPQNAVGFYPEVIKTGSGAGTWHWAETNGNRARPDTAPYWGRIQLSVKRSFFTFYTGTSTGPVPVLDGRIDEAVWNGAYQREMTLSNYHYSALKARFFGLEDSANNTLYVGLRVYDTAVHAGDFCQVYQEENGLNATDSIRNYNLDQGAENSLKVTGTGQVTDYFWDVSAGQWSADNEAADSQSAAYRHAGAYVDCEFRILRSAGGQDIDIPKRGLLGFLPRYYDGNRADSLANFYWEYTTNNDAQLLSQHGSPVYHLSTGWTNLQLGGPFIEVRSPSAGQNIYDSVLVEIFLGSETPSVTHFFAASDTNAKTLLTSAGGGVWRGMWNLIGHPLGDETLVIRIRASNGLWYERLVDVIVIQAPVYLRPQAGGVNLRLLGNRSAAFRLEKSAQVRVQLRDLAGRILWSTRRRLPPGEHHISWPASKGKGGIQVLVLNRGKETFTRRIAVLGN